MISAIRSIDSMWPQCLQPSLGSISLRVWEQMCFENFQDGHHDSHLGCQKGTILAILNLDVASMPPIKFRLNLTYGLGEDLKNFKMAPVVAILEVRTEQF